jgi:hypothetical protein
MNFRLFTAAMLLVGLSFPAAAQTAASNLPQPQPLTSSSQQEVAQPQPSLGVALLLPGGRSVAYAAPLPRCAEKSLKPIPISGYDNVSAIGIYPHLLGDKVAVRVTAMLTLVGAKTVSSRPDEPSPVGDYVIGGLGDSLKLADLKKLGLPPFEVRVVNEGFSLICCTDPDNGLLCCGTSVINLCANCQTVCPQLADCGSGAAALTLPLDLGVAPAKKREASHKPIAGSASAK